MQENKKTKISFWDTTLGNILFALICIGCGILMMLGFSYIPK